MGGLPDQRLLAASKNLAIHHFGTISDFLDWYAQQSNPVQIFSDYELLGESQTGLHILENLKLGNNAILVTSHYENSDIIENCQKTGVRLLPKNLLTHLSIKVVDSQVIDLVLIDDSDLLCQSWELAAESSGRNILTYHNLIDFKKSLAILDRATPIYIDSNLGDSIRGEEYAKELFDQGFADIYLVTGYPASHFGAMPWIKSIIDKTPPF